MTLDTDMVVTFILVLISISGAALGFSIGYYRAKKRKDMEVRHAL